MMKFFLFVIFCNVVIGDEDQCKTCICGQTAHLQPDGQAEDYDYIVGGEKKMRKKYNWMVKIIGKGIGKDGKDKVCGGTILTGKHILTSAHCTYDNREKPPSQLEEGDYNLLEILPKAFDSLKNEVMKIDEYDDYDPNTGKNDVSILTLKEHIMFGETISPICLPSMKNEKNSATVFGFGRTEQEPHTKALMGAEVTIHGAENCKWIEFDDESEICAGNSTKFDICEGDDGGPLVVEEKQRFIQIGIATIPGSNDCVNQETNLAGLYQKVFYFKDWIMKTAKGAQDSNCEWM